MKTTDAVIGKWSIVFEHYGLPPITGKKHYKGKCPICGQKGKYRCDDQDGRGTFICVCNTGDGWKLLSLTQKKDFGTLANEIDAFLGIQSDKRSVVKKETDITAFRSRVTACYPNILNLKGTQGEAYLRNRGIHILPADNMKYCPDQPTHKGKLQALWSLVTDAKGTLCYLHRTYLDGDKKADITPQKKLDATQEENYRNYAVSPAIRLFPVSSALGIAEGVETALSCKQIYGVNTWSVVNTNYMKRFLVPNGVKHLIIFADMDWNAAGHDAAMECAHKNLLANNELEKVSVRWPDHGDFNDTLIDGDEVRELVFMKKQREKK
ncbi:toprim domain-containing protein [Photorhabdus sp. APURE]|uniref:DUF7146 domain-containing protein n=1 Tax=Photorhabdus aballayi TaxID=2991723 RepID=UPI00223D42A3|nr:toprim domain-containing protein [Photorhabdus aballayi]MCW7547141.1 toprim domain-containing protein [Photorhabdus aballayi]